MDMQEKRNIFSDVHQSATAAANKDFQGRHQSSEEISTLKKKRDQEICIFDVELVLTEVFTA